MREDNAKSNLTKIRVRCATCGGSFGLIRHRSSSKQFCSKHCLEQYLAKRKQQPFDLQQWMDFARQRLS
jgi:endogenous inhibitor of DNA gyrase (YacG/DUF329 family)